MTTRLRRDDETAVHVPEDDCVVVTDGGQLRDSFEEDVEAQLSGRQTEPVAGGVAIDLVTRQPLFVRQVKYDDLREHYREEGYNLLTYKTHPYLPVTADDAVYECVFISRDPESAHKPERRTTSQLVG
jgi:hypothetical protein